jgi:hypothetical protein
MQIGLHDDGEQAWSTRRRRSNKLGKNDPTHSLGIRSSKIPSRGRQQRLPMPVALDQPRLGPLMGRRRSRW